MRIFFLSSLIIALFSCNNNLNTIGDTMIPSQGHVEMTTYNIEETSTVRLDSFPTSVNTLSSLLDSKQLTLGCVDDQITGKIVATPFFHIVGKGFFNFNPNADYVYDSLTLTLPYTGKILAGDTTSIQTYRLHRLTDYPRVNYEEPHKYSNYTLPYEEEALATLKIKFEKEAFTNSVKYFKLKDDLGRELFKRMQARDSIFDARNWLEFVRYFNGLAIVPDPNNTTLIRLDVTAAKLTCHFHSGSDNTSKTFTLSAVGAHSDPYPGLYAFTNIKHTPSDWLKGVTWKKNRSFKEAQQAVVQGLNGYAVKLKLPYIHNNDAYKTILKAEIVLKPKIGNSEDIPELKNTSIQLFTLDKYERLISHLTDISKKPVYGYLQANPNYQESRSYIIDITDYYNGMVSGPPLLDPQLNLLIGLAGGPATISSGNSNKTMVGSVATTFDRLVIDELPILRIYYAKYK